MIKKAVAFLPCHVLFYVGCAFSYIGNRFDIGFMYAPYNRCMLWSADLSDWSDLGVWTRVNEHRQDTKSKKE